jgi:hypothetical protein
MNLRRRRMERKMMQMMSKLLFLVIIPTAVFWAVVTPVTLPTVSPYTQRTFYDR